MHYRQQEQLVPQSPPFPATSYSRVPSIQGKALGEVKMAKRLDWFEGRGASIIPYAFRR